MADCGSDSCTRTLPRNSRPLPTSSSNSTTSAAQHQNGTITSALNTAVAGSGMRERHQHARTRSPPRRPLRASARRAAGPGAVDVRNDDGRAVRIGGRTSGGSAAVHVPGARIIASGRRIGSARGKFCCARGRRAVVGLVKRGPPGAACTDHRWESACTCRQDAARTWEDAITFVEEADEW